MKSIKAEGLLTDWQDAVGLKIIGVDFVSMNEYDDAIELTIITFNNGVVAIQRDQTGAVTHSGLLDNEDVMQFKKHINLSFE